MADNENSGTSNSSGNKISIKFPAPDQKVSYNIDPDSKIDLEGINLENAQIDILGNDLIISDPNTGAQVVLVGMVLYLFDEDSALSFFINGTEIEAQQLLSKVGEVGNLTVKDFIEISSIMPDKNSTSSEDGEGNEGDGKKSSEDEESEISETAMLLISAASDNAQYKIPPVDQKKSDLEQEFVSSSPATAIDEKGTFEKPAVESASSSSSAVDTTPNVNTSTKTADPEPVTPAQFEARVLQVASEFTANEDIGGGVLRDVFRGGGGSEASFFNPDNEVQYSTEVINLTGNPNDLVVYADNDSFFSTGLMSRVVEIEPLLPSGFEVKRIVISDLPTSFDVVGATATAEGYVIDPAVANASGDFQFKFQYGVPSTEDFTFNLTLNTEFNQTLYDALNPDGPSITPDETIVDITTPQRVEVKDVFGPNDLNYVDSDGNVVWVLANLPNNNRIFTSVGDDTVYGGIVEDTINTSLGNDIIFGNDGNDTIVAGGGDDIISGGSGFDTIMGDSGIDTVVYSDTNLNVDLNLGLIINGFSIANIDQAGPEAQQDRIRDVENIIAGGGLDTLTGDSNTNIIDGGAGDDTLYASAGADIMDGGDDIDTIDFSTISSISNFVSVTLDTSNDAVVTVDGGTNQTVRNVENVIGTDGNDIISGDSNDNIIAGVDGDDRLSGRGGLDVLDGGDGSDTADYYAAAAAVDVDLLAGGASDDGDGSTDTFISIENVSGSAFDDNIAGDNAANVLHGAGGDDTITGAGGDDTFLASAGADTLDGEADNDTIDYSGLGTATAIDVTLSDAVDAVVDVTGEANDTIRNIENVIGTTGDDRIYGDAQDNTLDGSAGNDSLGGGAGNDTLIGGAGADRADYSLAASSVSVDLLVGATTNDGDGGVDTLTEIENVLGSDFNDDLRGDGFVNTLEGGLGDDNLSGRGGNDTLDGGVGGSDTADYSDAAASINVDMSTGGAINDGDGGSDTFIDIENVRGSAQDDTISGDADDNILSGDDGDDTLFGAGGDDTLQGDDGGDTLIASAGADTLDGGDDVDTADYSGLGGAIAINVTLAGATNSTVFVAGGTDDVIRNIENITATNNDDTITGDIFSNTILGLGGNDIIRGGAGADILDGGAGNDVLRFDELSGLGVVLDLTNQAATYLLDTSIDSFSNFESYFTTLNADTIIGSNAADIVSSLGGNDLFLASDGNDVLDGGNDSDTIDYSNLAGVNFIDVTLSESVDATVTVDGGDDDTIRNIENVVGTAGDDTIVGDTQNNNLVGRAGNDDLQGGDGDDKLEGGLGNDNLVGGAGVDEIIGGSGIDTADYSSSTGNVDVNLAAGEATIDGLGGSDTLSSIENITGSDQNDILTGNGIANVINAGAGNDVVAGGAGSDTLDGGLGIDDLRFDELTGQGITIDIGAETATYAPDGSIDSFTDFERYFTTNQGDIITGSANVDTVFGLGGNDTFNASGGIDILDGGADIDTIDYSMSGVTSITVILDSITPVNVTVVGGDDDSIVNFENVTGSTGNDSITGDEFVNNLRGGAGDDVIRGGGGSDILDGGAGTDTVRFDDLTGTGVDLNIATGDAFYAGDGTNDKLSTFEIYYVSNQDDVITGSANADTVFALNGSDIFISSAGNDVLDGGLGSDTVDYSNLTGLEFITATLNGAVASTVTVNGGDNDSVVNVENITGTINNDTITGDANANTLDGFSGDDTLDGAGGNDTLLGGLGNDTLQGGAGNDTLDGGDGTDNILGGAGNDTFIGGDGIDNVNYSSSTGAVTVDLGSGVTANDGLSGNDTLSEIENVIGSNFNDDLSGDIGTNVLTGGEGNDTLYGAGGNDTLDGGDGTDTVDYTNAAAGVTIDLGAGTTSNDGDSGSDTLISIENLTGSTFNDDITGDGYVNIIDAGLGDDIIRYSGGADDIEGGTGSDTVDYSTLTVANPITVALNGTSDVTVDIAGATNQTISGVENVIGTAGDDVITGDSNANTLEGLDGDDTLSGRNGFDILDGGDGVDTADYSNAVGTINVNLTVGAAALDGFGQSDTLIDIENVVGSFTTDTITGDEEANVLEGGDGDDVLDGAAGDDVLNGGNDNDFLRSGEGDDTFIGGNGVDEISYANAGAGVTVNLDTNNAADDGDGGTDTITLVENLTGSTHADDLTGSGGNNVIDGGDSDDLIDGGLGDDTIQGGSGIDTASYLSAGGSVSVDLSSDSATGSAGSDTLDSIENIIGSNSGDVILGDGTDNRLEGRGGNDRIYGDGGNDYIDGGAGTDEVDYSTAAAGVTANLGAQTTSDDGDVGVDTLISIEDITGSAFDDNITGSTDANTIDTGAGDDIIIGTLGADVIDGGDDSDTLDYSGLTGITGISFTLADGTPITVTLAGGTDQIISNVENIIASSADDVLIGDANDNTLSGGAGNDILSGRGGMDTLDGGDDIDTADYSDAVGAINVNLDAGVAAIDGDGSNDILIDIENVTGSDNDDIITGDAGVNTLLGGLGADTLDGGAEDDILSGGAGADTILSGAGDDTIDGGSGVDVVDYSLAAGDVTVDLSANSASDDGDGGVDTITLVENIIGSDNDDTLTGNTDDNNINGGIGDDTLAGLGGTDVLDGGAGTNDTVDYSRATGNVIVNLQTENAVSDGSGASDTLYNLENVTGSDQDDTITGSSVGNIINAADGADTIRGGGGNDTIDGGDGVDTIDYSTVSSNGVTVNLATGNTTDDGDGASDTLSNIENIVGSVYADNLTGDAGNNVISGGGNTDTLVGGAGDDTLDGGADIDTVDYSGATNGVTANMFTNTVSDDGFGDTDILSSIENFVGSNFDDNVIGNNDDNRIETGLGDDVLNGRGGDDYLDGGVGGSDTASYSFASGGVIADLQSGNASSDGQGGTDTLVEIENLEGSGNDDQLFGDAGDNTLSGLGGNDTLRGRAGDDILDGGAGIDTADYANAAGSVTADIAANSASDDGDSGVDTFINIQNLSGSANADTLSGDAADNVLSGAGGNDTLVGRGGVDDLQGGAGIDTIDYSGAGSFVDVDLLNNVVTNDGDGANDTTSSIENVTGSNFDDDITGSTGANVLLGGTGDDTLYGADGNDTIDGGADTDTVDYSNAAAGIVVDLGLATNQTSDDGDGGVDTLISIENIIGSTDVDDITGDASVNDIDAGEGDDLIRYSGGADTIDGGDDRDTIDFTNLGGANFIDVDLNGSTDTTVNISASTNQTIVNIENVTGTANNDIIDGDNADNTLIGGAGNDVIRGGLGNDTLDGGADVDDLRFDDIIGGDGVTLNLITSQASFSGDGSLDNFSNFERYYTSNQDDVITTSVGADEVYGLAGDDNFTASAGADDLNGGLGVDTIDYSAFGATNFINVTLDGINDAAVTVNSGVTQTISSFENIIGTAGNDTITGDAQDNEIDGSAGDDILNAGAGTDLLEGGAGNDTFTGSAGQNTYDGGTGVDMLDYSTQAGITGIDVTLGGAGDAVVTVVGETNDLVRNVENVRGTAFDDTIGGDSEDNMIYGLAGADTLSSGGGADLLDGGDDVDTLDYSMQAGVTSIELTLDTSNNAIVDVTGQSDITIVNIENVIGSTGGDTITGDSLSNLIDGFDGNDTLVGGAGYDYLDGGDGVDTVDYSVEAGVTAISVILDGSNYAVVTVTGGSDDEITNIENVIGTTGDDTIIGDTRVNSFEGGAGNDTFSTLAGDDIVDGGAGIDTLTYNYSTAGIVADMSTLDGGGFFDIIVNGGGSNYTDKARLIEILEGSFGNDDITGSTNNDTLRGLVGNDTIDGNDGDDIIDGGDGDDTLIGGAGIDTIDGGANDDTIDGGAGDDIINAGDGVFDTILWSAGSDTINGGAGNEDAVDYSSLTAVNFIDITLDGSTASDVLINGLATDNVRNIEKVIGSQGNDIIRGDTNNNFLFGGLGDDTFFAEGGNDDIFGGDGVDTIDYSSLLGGISMDATGGAAVLVSINVGGVEADRGQFIERIIGGQGDDTIYSDDTVISYIDGGLGDDSIRMDVAGGEAYGGAGDDTIEIGRLFSTNGVSAYGEDGADNFQDRDGGNILDGGDGIDRASFFYNRGITVDLLDAGVTTVNISGRPNTTIENIENITGAFNYTNNITGNSLANNILGGNVADNFFASLGGDTYDGRNLSAAGNNIIDYSTLNGIISHITVNLNNSTNSTIILHGVAENDTVRNIRSIHGTDGNDIITGDNQFNHFYGNDGDDTLNGGTGGLNRLYGGNGNDIINGANTSDTFLNGDAGDDIINGNGGEDEINGGAGNDTLDGGDGADEVNGDAGDDIIFASFGVDQLDGGDGTDILSFANLVGESVSLDLTNPGPGYGLSGGGTGSVVNFETYILSDLNDTFEGTVGNDTVDGGAGEDTFLASDGADNYDGGDGNDTVDYSALAATAIVTVTTILNDVGASTVSIAGGLTKTDTLTDIENVTGSILGDSLTGNNQANVLTGNQGDDYLSGRDGNDTLIGGTGEDTLIGGAGDDDLQGGDDIDTADYSASTGPLSIDLTAGTASGDGADTLSDIENVIGGTNNDTITGNTENNILDGGAGNDTLYGVSGDNTFLTSAGNDTYNGGSGLNDVVDYSSVAGPVTVDLANNLATGHGTDTLNGVENIIATAGDDTVISDSANNVLDGGANSATGDTVSYASATGSVTASLLSQTASGAGAGNDTITNFENITGSGFADTLTGDGGDNTLIGGAGDDILIGGGGADDLQGGAGLNDLADYSSANVDLIVNLASGGASGQGADTLSGIENVTGGSGNDLFVSDIADNEFDGGGGTNEVSYSAAGSAVTVDLRNNSTSGGGGVDSLMNIHNITGSNFNDTFIGSTGDNYIDGAGGSDDLVDYSTSGSAINANLETGVVTGDGNDTLESIENIIGTAGDDTFVSSSASNRIEGGSAGNDTVSYEANSTGVTINLATDTASGDGNDDLISIENAIGGGGNDTITGDGGVNILSGGNGNDTIEGGDGNDTLDGGVGIDTLSYANATGSVTVNLAGGPTSGAAGADTISGFENITGSAFADNLTGDAGANTINAGAGDDTVYGSSGNDTLNGGLGNDTLDYSAIATGFSSGNLDGAGAGTLTNAGGTDTISGFTDLLLSSGNDTINMDTGAIASLSSVGGNGGTDTVGFTGADLTQEGSDMAALFSDVEEFDFTNIDLGGDGIFDIGNDDIDTISGGNDLTIFVNTGTIALTDINVLTQSGATISGDSTVGSTRTIDWDNGTQLTISGQ